MMGKEIKTAILHGKKREKKQFPDYGKNREKKDTGNPRRNDEILFFFKE